jgi:hypothetical protein
MSGRIVLGTAQFGMPYGIANRTGVVDRLELSKILEHAWREGVDTLDTAAAYGDSERRLGEAGVQRWRIISKVPAVPASEPDAGAWVRGSIADSLRLTGMPSLYGMLLHQPSQLLGPKGGALYRAMLEARDRGEVGKIGVSIYAPEDLDALAPQFDFDLVQGPMNVFDRRLAKSGWLAKLRATGVEIHIRSIFLQGLLLMDASKRPVQFDSWKPLWEGWDRWLDEQSLTPIQACVGFGFSQREVDGIVVGVDSLHQLQEILSSAKSPPVPPPDHLQSDDLDLINPSRWSRH